MNHIFLNKSPPYLIRKIGFYYHPDQQLKQACQNGNLNIANIALLLGAQINGENYEDGDYYVSKENLPPLIIATNHNQLEMVKYLIKQGAELDAHDTSDNEIDGEWTKFRYGTALHYALIEKHSEIAKYLINQGADVNINHSDNDNWTPLIYACRNEDPEMVKLLLDHGANPNEQEPDCGPPLEQAINTENPEIVKLLVEYGADVNEIYRPYLYANPLCQAVFNGNLPIIKILLAAGADLHYTHPYDPAGIPSSLYMAKHRNRPEIIDFLTKLIEKK